MNYDNSVTSALNCAQEEARRLNSAAVGAEHVLLGVLHPKNTLFAADVFCHFQMNLATLDIMRQDLLMRMEKPGAGIADKEPVFLHAAKLAAEHDTIPSIYHLVLGLAYQRDSLAARSLDRFGVDYEAALKTLAPFLGNPLGDAGEELRSTIERDYLNIFSQECMVIESKTAAAVEGFDLASPIAGLTELKLLGILDLGDSLATEALTKLEVDLEALRGELVEGAESLKTDEGDESSDAARRMSHLQNWTLYLARAAGSPKVKAEHILLALLWDGDNLSAKALGRWNVDYQKAVDALQDVYNELGEKDERG